MANVNVAPTTLNGDGITPFSFWLDATSAQVLVGTVRKPASMVTTQGDDIHLPESWDSLNVAVVIPSKNLRALNEVFDSVAGYIFGINSPTLQPQLPRSTQFPYAP